MRRRIAARRWGIAPGLVTDSPAHSSHEAKGSDEADSLRFDFRRASNAVRLEPYPIGREQHAPELLSDARGLLAADGFLPIQKLGPDLVVAELELPAPLGAVREPCNGMGAPIDLSSIWESEIAGP
ncbi:MAG: hypothetical protein ABSF69_11325 [Polyangiaceae bacterium]|jgi:hypothetical protein